MSNVLSNSCKILVKQNSDLIGQEFKIIRDSEHYVLLRLLYLL